MPIQWSSIDLQSSNRHFLSFSFCFYLPWYNYWLMNARFVLFLVNSLCWDFDPSLGEEGSALWMIICYFRSTLHSWALVGDQSDNGAFSVDESFLTTSSYFAMTSGIIIEVLQSSFGSKLKKVFSKRKDAILAFAVTLAWLYAQVIWSTSGLSEDTLQVWQL